MNKQQLKEAVIKTIKEEKSSKGQRLKSIYENFEEFLNYDELYNLHKRLGYSTAKEAWMSNPVVHTDVDPSKYRKISN